MLLQCHSLYCNQSLTFQNGSHLSLVLPAGALGGRCLHSKASKSNIRPFCKNGLKQPSFLCKSWILSFTNSTLTTSTPSAQGSWKLLARTPLDGLPAEAPHSESACLLHWSLLVLWLVARNGEKASKKNWRSCDQIIR